MATLCKMKIVAAFLFVAVVMVGSPLAMAYAATTQAAIVAPVTALKIDVVASGVAVKGAPVMMLRVNGKNVSGQTVANNDAGKVYSFSLPMPNPFNAFSLVFVNPASGSNGVGRTLDIKSVTVNGVILSPTQGFLIDTTGKSLPGVGKMTSFGELMFSVWGLKDLVAKLYPQVPVVDKTLHDNQGYTSGSYTAYVSPWGKGTYVQGKDYTEQMDLVTRTFPNNTTISWNWPNVPAKSGVYNFDAIDFGNYYGTVPQKPITPKQIKNIKTLTEDHNLALSGNLEGFDVIDDLFLTQGANDVAHRLYEIEILLHTPAFAVAYAGSVKQLGTYTVGGVDWKVSINDKMTPKDILIMPANHADIIAQKVDVKALFDALVAHGVLTGNEWFNGFGLGSETRLGSGAVKVKTFTVTYN